MKVTLQSTTKMVDIDGVPARIWEGTTESGIQVHAFITRIACDKDANQEEFKQELKNCLPPSEAIDAYPTKLVL